MRRRVVVTGMGCISPVGNTVKDTWDAMLAGIVKEVLRGSGPLQWLKTGLQMGSAATQLAAGKIPSKQAMKTPGSFAAGRV